MDARRKLKSLGYKILLNLGDFTDDCFNADLMIDWGAKAAVVVMGKGNIDEQVIPITKNSRKDVTEVIKHLKNGKDVREKLRMEREENLIKGAPLAHNVDLEESRERLMCMHNSKNS